MDRRIGVLLGTLVLTTANAAADVSLGVHLGGGMEGGMITGALRPDAVAETGVLVEYLPAGRRIGIAAIVEAVGRLTRPVDVTRELKADVLVRWALDDLGAHMGIGMGVRTITLPDGATLRGYDLLRMEGNHRFATWAPANARARMALDGYLSWTFGCYVGSYTTPVAGDNPPKVHALGCLGGLTTTYVLGVRTTVVWR